MSSNYDKSDAAISLLLSRKEMPFIESPLRNKTITKFYHDINTFSKRVATVDEKEKIGKKYREFSDYLMSEENNEFYREAIIFENIIIGIDKISNYKGRQLLSLYCYFTYIYSKIASFKEDGVKEIRRQFTSVINKDTFVGIYDLRFPGEAKRCVMDALNNKYTLTDDELRHVERMIENADSETKALIHKLFMTKYDIGKSSNLDKKDLASEFKRLYFNIVDESFEAQYGRKINLVDMYLMTNIQPEDFNKVTNVGLPSEEAIKLLQWFKAEYTNKFSNDSHTSRMSYMSGPNLGFIIKRMSSPTNLVIDSFNNGEFGEYQMSYFSQEDLNKTYAVLLDLNRKYGLKMDPYTYICILNSVICGEEGQYYTIAETYKPILDKKTHIVESSNPTFTRRYKNEGK